MFYKRGLEIQNDSEVRKKYALLLGRDKKNLGEAVSEYRRLVAEFPKDQTLRGEYRKLLTWDRRFLKEAIQEYDEYISQFPQDYDAKLQLAKLLAFENTDLKRSESLLEEVSKKKGSPFELDLDRARILANTSGREDDASELYKKLLKKRYSIRIQEEHADLLAKRAKTRNEAVGNFGDLVRREPNNDRMRIKFGQLLLAEKDTVKLASQQFNYVLKRDRRNAEAHRGAALAYSVLGENDKALYHSREAEKLGVQAKDVRGIDEQLSVGREPKIGARLAAIVQPSSGFYNLNYWTIGTFAIAEPTPFTRVNAELGGAYVKDNEESAGGGYARLEGQYRFTEKISILAKVHYNTLPMDDRRTEYSLHMRFPITDLKVHLSSSVGFRFDSLTSFRGKSLVDESLIGAARNHLAMLEVESDLFPLYWKAQPYGGYVESGGADHNDFYGLTATVSYDIERLPSQRYGLTYRFDTFQYAEDRSSVGERKEEPFADGYFSPKMFVGQAFQGFFDGDVMQPNLKLRAALGPNLQYAKTAEVSGKTVIGVEGYANVYWEPSERFGTFMNLSVLRLPDINFQFMTTAGFFARF